MQHNWWVHWIQTIFDSIDHFLTFFFQVHSENFENHIKNTLQRTTSQPLLASGSTALVTPSEYIHLLNRAMVTLRTNYMQPQKIARMDMEKRCVNIQRNWNTQNIGKERDLLYMQSLCTYFEDLFVKMQYTGSLLLIRTWLTKVFQ